MSTKQLSAAALAGCVTAGWLGFGAPGCGEPASRGPFFDDARYLRFGVVPAEEAKRVIARQKRVGRELQLRLDAEDFIALGFSAGPRDGAVRVITRRGLELALGPGFESEQPAPVYGLLEPPLPGTHDVDGNGLDDLFVEHRDAGRRCLLGFEATANREIAPRPLVGLEVGEDVELCIEQVVDLDDDSSLEALTVVSLVELATLWMPEVTVALVIDARVFRFVVDAPAHQYQLEIQRARRQRELQQARRAQAHQRSYRLAVELAALSRFAGDPPGAQQKAFDEALAGLELSSELRRAAARARAYIAAGWKRP